MITNAPERIFLNYGDTQGEAVDHKDCQEVSWSDHRVFSDDVEYVRLDTVIDFVNLSEERKEMLRDAFLTALSTAMAKAAVTVSGYPFAMQPKESER